MAYFGPSWNYLGTFLGHFGTILAALSGSRAVLGRHLAVFGRALPLKIARDAILSTGMGLNDLGPFGTVRVLRHLGPAFGRLWAAWAALGRSRRLFGGS